MKQKRGLGRGLNAIFNTDEDNNEVSRVSTSKSSGVGEVSQIAIPSIKPNPSQPRRSFDNDKLEELAESIKSLGVIQPITVHREEGAEDYIIISGERRWRASQIAGLRTIPAYVREADNEKLHAMALVENLQREDLNPIEIATALQQLINDCSLTQEEVAQMVGFKRSSIANYLRLLRLCAKVQSALSQGVISMGHAKAIGSLPEESRQEELLDKCIELSLSVRQSEELARAMQQPTQSEEPTEEQTSTTNTTEYPESYSILVERMERLFSRNISIKRRGDKGGKIIIDFKSDEEIEHFVEQLSELK